MFPLPVRDAVELAAALCSDAEPCSDQGDPVERALLELIGLRTAEHRRAGWPLAVAGGLGLHIAAMLLPGGRELLDLAALAPSAWLVAGVLTAIRWLS